MLLFLKYYSQAVKTERKLNYENYETINIQPIKGSGLKIRPTREEASRKSAPDVQ
jgi:hypothetical protein